MNRNILLKLGIYLTSTCFVQSADLAQQNQKLNARSSLSQSNILSQQQKENKKQPKKAPKKSTQIMIDPQQDQKICDSSVEKYGHRLYAAYLIPGSGQQNTPLLHVTLAWFKILPIQKVDEDYLIPKQTKTPNLIPQITSQTKTVKSHLIQTLEILEKKLENRKRNNISAEETPLDNLKRFESDNKKLPENKKLYALHFKLHYQEIDTADKTKIDFSRLPQFEQNSTKTSLTSSLGIKTKNYNEHIKALKQLIILIDVLEDKLNQDQLNQRTLREILQTVNDIIDLLSNHRQIKLATANQKTETYHRSDCKTFGSLENDFISMKDGLETILETDEEYGIFSYIDHVKSLIQTAYHNEILNFNLCDPKDFDGSIVLLAESKNHLADVYRTRIIKNLINKGDFLYVSEGEQGYIDIKDDHIVKWTPPGSNLEYKFLVLPEKGMKYYSGEDPFNHHVSVVKKKDRDLSATNLTQNSNLAVEIPKSIQNFFKTKNNCTITNTEIIFHDIREIEEKKKPTAQPIVRDNVLLTL